MVSITVRRTAIALLFGCASCVPSDAPLQGQTDELEVIRAWASERHYPVHLRSESPGDWAFLRELIGDARVVALGEGMHGIREPLEFRNQLFRFLATEMGFGAIAMESGIVESFFIDDYVAGGEGDPVAVAEAGMSYGFGAFPQQHELIEWMRGTNLAGAHERPLSFLGFDVSVGAGEGSGLERSLAYLDHVSPDLASRLRARVAPFADRLWIDRTTSEGDQYTSLFQPERDRVTAVIADLVSVFELERGAFVERTSNRRYQAAYRSAIAARQADRYLRQFPPGWSPEQGPVLSAVTAADHGKLENARWILESQGVDGRIMLFAHYGHVATTPVRVHLPDGTIMPLPTMVGEYLDWDFGDDVVTIGHLIGEDASRCGEPERQPDEGTLEHALGSVAVGDYVLDLRDAPADVRSALGGEHALFGTEPPHALDILAGTDLVLFTPRVTPALACEEVG